MKSQTTDQKKYLQTTHPKKGYNLEYIKSSQTQHQKYKKSNQRASKRQEKALNQKGYKDRKKST